MNCSNDLNQWNKEVERDLQQYKLNEALAFIWSQITEADKKINEEKPWELSTDKTVCPAASSALNFVFSPREIVSNGANRICMIKLYN